MACVERSCVARDALALALWPGHVAAPCARARRARGTSGGRGCARAGGGHMRDMRTGRSRVRLLRGRWRRRRRRKATQWRHQRRLRLQTARALPPTRSVCRRRRPSPRRPRGTWLAGGRLAACCAPTCCAARLRRATAAPRRRERGGIAGLRDDVAALRDCGMHTHTPTRRFRTPCGQGAGRARCGAPRRLRRDRARVQCVSGTACRLWQHAHRMCLHRDGAPR